MSKQFSALAFILLLITSILSQIQFASGLGGLKFYSQSTAVYRGTEITSHAESHVSDDAWYQIDTVKVGVFSVITVDLIFSVPLIEPNTLVQISVFSEAHIKNGSVAGYMRIFNYASSSWKECFAVNELSDTDHEKIFTANLTDYVNNGEMKLQAFYNGYPQSFFQDYTFIQLTTKPNAAFTYTPSIILFNKPVTFNASASYDLDGAIVSYEWDLGDSTIKTGMVVTHTYIELGNFTVTLTVMDDDGLVDTASMNITVKNSPPIANFTFSPLAPVVGEAVTFDGSFSSPEGGVIVGYYWNFGDGANDAGAIVTHVYEYSDTFNVTLMVVDSEGLNATLEKQVTVYTRNIAIVNLTPSTSKAYMGQVVAIYVGVRNFGNEPQTFNVTVYYGGDNVTIETKLVSLEPFETATVVFYWNTSNLVYKISYTIKAEATVLPLETDVTDNILVNGTVRVNLLGDANNDGIVNIKDATLLSIAWLAKEGSPSYNEDADFNRDGIINIKDASLLGAHWGEKAEPTFVVSHVVSWSGQEYRVVSKSNCTVSNVAYDGVLRSLSFNVSGPKGIKGYFEMTIPNSLISGPFTVLIDGSPVSFLILNPNFYNFTIRATFTLSTHQVQISGYVPPLLSTLQLSFNPNGGPVMWSCFCMIHFAISL